MSRAFVASFFPSTFAWLYRGLPTLVDAVLPAALDATCPPVVVVAHWSAATASNHSNNNNNDDAEPVILLRYPVLAVAALTGVLVGLYGNLYWTRQSSSASVISARDAPNQEETIQHHHHHQCQRYAHALRAFAWAFGFFAAMNAVALPLHCGIPLLPKHPWASFSTLSILTMRTTTSTTTTITTPMSTPQQFPLLWMLDCLCTGCSSLSLVHGALALAGCLERPTTTTTWQWCRWQSYPRATTQDASSWHTRSPHAATAIAAPVVGRRPSRLLLLLLVLLLPLLLALSRWGPVVDDGTTRPTNHGNHYYWKEPLWTEWIYLGPLGLALCVCPPVVLLSLYQGFVQRARDPLFCRHYHAGVAGVAVMAAGLGLGVAGLWRTTAWCQSWPADGGYLPSLFFGGCTVSFAGMHLWLVQVDQMIRPGLRLAVTDKHD